MSASIQAGSHGLSPASSLALSEVQSPSASSPASTHLEHMGSRHGPARVSSYLSRASEHGGLASDCLQDPQIPFNQAQVCLSFVTVPL